MNKSVITLDANQLALVKDGKQVILCEVLADQPLDGCEFDQIGGIPAYGCALFSKKEGKFNKGIAIPLQYPVGTVLGVRETWAWNVMAHQYIYKADYSEDALKAMTAINWNSSQTMPKDAIRTHVKVVDVRVCRVRDISHFDWERIGAWYDNERSFLINANWIKQWFNAKYAKPRARRKKGKIVGYECWVYDNSKESMARFDKYLMGDYYYYKNKPLKVHFRPFAELTTLETK